MATIEERNEYNSPKTIYSLRSAKFTAAPTKNTSASGNIFVASGLGSSGLTTGPLIGKNLVDLVMNRSGSLDSADYPVTQYVKKKGQ